MAPPRRLIRSLLPVLLAASCVAHAAVATEAQDLEAARAAIRTKEFPRAVDLLRKPAEAGSSDALFVLGSLERFGLGTALDVRSARAHLAAAAEHGHVGAAYALAASFAREEPIDRAAARRWLEQAAAAGHELARAALTRGAMPLQFVPHRDLSDESARRAAFFVAAQEDSVEVLAALADSKLIAATDAFGRTALAMAAQCDAAQAVRLLLQRGASVAQADTYGVTPLMLAARHARVEVIDVLLDAHADADATDREGNTALMFASARDANAPPIVERLLRVSKHPAATNSAGWSALDWAVHAESHAAAALLREHGLTAHATVAIAKQSPSIPLRRVAADAYRGWSDVEIAALRGDAQLLQMVRDERERPQSSPAVIRAAAIAQSTALPRLLDASAANTLEPQTDLLHWAIRHGDPETVRALVAHRVGTRVVKSPEPALNVAVRARRAAIVRVLLDAQFDVNAVDVRGRSPLMLAAQSGQADLVTELLVHLARTDAVDDRGRSALWYAACAGDDASVAALLAAKASANIADEVGQTALGIAAANRHEKIVAKLLQAGASGATATKDGTTPLMFAARSGDVASLRLLLSGDASLDAQNRHGDTALILAARNAQADAVVALVKAGASGKLRNADRMSALDVASALGLAQIERLLATS